jgi:hypothetical protein
MVEDNDQTAEKNFAIFCDLLLAWLRAEDIAKDAYNQLQETCKEIRDEAKTTEIQSEMTLSEEDKARLARLNAEMAKEEAAYKAEAKAAAQTKTPWAWAKAEFAWLRAVLGR